MGGFHDEKSLSSTYEVEIIRSRDQNLPFRKLKTQFFSNLESVEDRLEQGRPCLQSPKSLGTPALNGESGVLALPEANFPLKTL